MSRRLAGAINTARATVASHATTAQIWTVLGNQIDWTGTATTTIFPNAPQAGAERTLICAGACSFIAGTNMLIDGVASGTTTTCAINDTVIVRAISTTQFKLSIIKYAGVAEDLTYIGTVTAANVFSVMANLPYYKAYKIFASNINQSTNYEALMMTVSTDNGATWVAAGNYDGTIKTATYATANSANISMNSYGYSGAFDMTLFNRNLNGKASFLSFGSFKEGASNNVLQMANGTIAVSTNINAVKFNFQSNNMVTGTFIIYGMRG
ncbi:MAG: hypothetical protein NTW78_03905 [Campylobacterales bacterium]|nr:hypothetical protein [Campylobacterales bacterium]